MGGESRVRGVEHAAAHGGGPAVGGVEQGELDLDGLPVAMIHDAGAKVGRLARIEGVDDLTLTTNGSLLARKAQALKEAGLNRVTVSLDSMDDTVFMAMNDVGFPVQSVLDGIAAAAGNRDAYAAGPARDAAARQCRDALAQA